MINHPEGLWQSAKKAYFPSNMDSENEKRLKTLFLQGMWAGRELVIKSLELDDRAISNFNTELRDQLISALKELGHHPVKIHLGTQPKPTIKTRINGEEV